MTTNETSAGGSETPTPVPTPATGTAPTATGGATPPVSTATPTLEEVQRRYEDLERSHKNAKEELERHRKNAKKLADYEKAEQEARDAALSEVDKSNKRAQEAEAKIEQYQKQLVTAQVKLAAQSKGIIDPDLAALAIQGALEYGEDGMPTNIDKALDALMKQKPYLVAKPAEPTPATPAQTTPSPTHNTPAIPAMNPGRTNIPAPGSNPPGTPFRRPSLSDPGVFVPPGTRSPWQP